MNLDNNSASHASTAEAPLVSIHLFALARDLAQTPAVEIRLPVGSTVKELRETLGAEYPSLRGLLAQAMIAVNAEYAADEEIVPAGAEIACIPPVSGG